ncbi:hypothetical protein ACF06O_30660 [Streptomyces albidoflavus]
MADDDKQVDPAAPHGRDENGTPLAPYGYKANGDPRVSNRGRVAAPGKKATANTRSGARPKGRSKGQTKSQLVELVGMVTTPLATAAASPALGKKLGERQALALAGDAVILDAFAEPLVDAVMVAAESKPGLLAWMDKVEDKAGYLMLAQTGAQLVKALVQNHMAPDKRLAEAARTMVQVKAARYAAAIQAEAAALGLDDPVPQAA